MLFATYCEEPCTTVIWPPSLSNSQIIKSETSAISKFEEKRLSICSEEVCSIASKTNEVFHSIMEEDRCPSPVPMEVNLKGVRKETVEKTVIEAGERVLKTRSVTPQPFSQPRPLSPWAMTSKSKSPELLDISSKPHDVQSLLPPACLMRPMSPQQVVVFPPDCPTVIYSRSPTPQIDIQKAPERLTTCSNPTNAVVPRKQEIQTQKSESNKTSKEHSKREKINKKEHKTEKDHKSDKEHKIVKEHKSDKEHKNEKNHKSTIAAESKKMDRKEEGSVEVTKMEKLFYTKSEVERLIHEEVSKALLTKESKTSKYLEEQKSEPVSVHDLPKPITQSGWMTNALTTASERPFSPISFPKPLELPSVSSSICPMEPVKIKKDEKPVPLPSETKPYFPPEPPPPEKEKMDERVGRALREVGCRSPFTEALTVAPERSYSPIPTFTTTIKPASKSEAAFKPIPVTKKQISMTSALTIAPSVPFTVPGKTPIPKAVPTVSINDVGTGSAFTPITSKTSSIMKTEKHSTKSEKTGICVSLVTEGGKTRELVRVSPVPHPIVAPSIKPTPAYIPQPTDPKKETCSLKKETHGTSRVDSQSEKVEVLQTKSASLRPISPSGLHPPNYLPYYQQNIGEIPVRNRSISPVPHQIKAPEVNPKPLEYAHVSDAKKQAQYKSTIFSETRTYSAQKSGLKSTNVLGTHKKEELKPEREGLSPHSWKVQKYRQVQNLSPITVRLPSPRPVSPRPPTGETVQAADAKVFIHKPRPSSPLPPIVKVNVKYPPVTTSGTTIGSEKSAFSKAGKSVETTHSSVQKKNTETCQKQCSESVSKAKSQKVEKLKLPIEQNSIYAQNGQNFNIDTEKEQTSVCQKNISQVKESTSTQQGKQSSKEIGHKQHAVSSTQRIIHMEQGSAASQQMIQKEQEKSCCQQMIHKEKNISNSQLETHKEQRTSRIQKADSRIEQHTTQTAQKSMTISEISSKGFHETDDTKKRISPPCGITSFRAYGETSQKTLSHQGYNTSIKDIVSTKSNKKLTSNKTNILQDNKITVKSNASDQSPHPTFPSLPQLSDVTRTAGAGGVGGRTGTLAGSSAPKRGRGILNPSVAPGARIPLCGHCNMQIRGPFITALGKIWCPEHFVCVNAKCNRPLQDIGFVEEADGLYCEFCFEKYLAPSCDKCNSKIKGDCLNAIGKHFHPECFACAYCGKLFGNNPFFLEDSLPYCETDWNELFTTKCFSCGFPIEAGDRWVEALNNNYHSQCFNCTMCKKNLEGQSFYAKAGRPFCKNHAR